MLEQTSSSYGGLKLGLFVTKWGLFAQFQRAPFGKSSRRWQRNATLFKRFRLFRSRFDSSDCQSPSKCFVLSNFDIPAYWSGWIFEKVIDGYKPSVPSTPLPLPNFPVPSSYKKGNCLSIPTSLDILDNIHPKKVAASLCGIWSRPETRAETRVFLKSETKTDRKAAVKITLRNKRSSAFCEKGKIAPKEFQWLKRQIFRFAIFWRKAHRCWSKQAQVTAVWN